MAASTVLRFQSDLILRPLRLLALGLGLVLLLAACQSSEERAEGHYQSALELLEVGDIDRATVEFRNVFQLDGQHTDARRTYALALREYGRFQESYSQFLRLAEQRPNDTVALSNLAEMALLGQNWPELLRHAGTLIEVVEETGTERTPRIEAIAVNLAYATALQDENDPDRRDAADSARALIADNPELFSLRTILADSALRDNDLVTAQVQIEAVLAEQPGNRQFQDLRLSILASQEDGPGVEAQLREMITLFPEDDELVAGLLRFLVSQGNTDGAEAFLRDRIEADPETAAETQLALVQFLLQIEGVEAALSELDALIEADPDTVTFRMLRASIRFDIGERDTAIDALQTLVDGTEEVNSDINDAKVALARMLMLTGNPVGAQRLVAEVLEADGSHVEALKIEANWLIEEDRADDAIGRLRLALEEAPEDADAMTLMARAHQRNGNHELARDFLSLAFEASGAAPEEALRYSADLVQAELYLAAEEVVIQALRLQPGDVQLLERLGRIYIAMADWPRAEQVEATARRLDDPAGDRLADGLRAARLAARGQMDEAVTFLQDLAGQAEGGDLAAQIAVIRALLADGREDEALAYARGAVTADPENLALLFARGATEAASGDTLAAQGTYREIVTLEPRAERAWTELIRTHFILGETEEAEAALQEALAVLPEGVNLLWAQASFLEQTGDFEGAISIYEELYSRVPNSLVVANNLASLISTYRDDDESLERAWTIARRLRGSEVLPFRDTYGWIAFRRGDLTEARPYLEDAAAGLSDDALVQFHYAMLLAAQNAHAEALAQFELALELAGPDDTRAQFETARAEVARLEALIAEAEEDAAASE